MIEEFNDLLTVIQEKDLVSEGSSQRRTFWMPALDEVLAKSWEYSPSGADGLALSFCLISSSPYG